MPKFLTQQEIYRILQRELPEGVYADGPPSAFFTTADMYATASGISGLYAKMQRVYDNYFPQYADEKIEDWETFVFNKIQTGLSLPGRRTKVINQLKLRPSLSLWEILTAAANFVPVGTFVQVVEWGCRDGSAWGWKLGSSRLGSETVLGWGYSKIGPDGADLCDYVIGDGWRLGTSHLGSETRLQGSLTYDEFVGAQMRAYMYEVRIFGYSLTPQEWLDLDLLLRRKEPARSGHVVLDGLSLTTFDLTSPVTNVDQFDGVDCIAVDSSQTTGYSGRIRPVYA